MLHGVNRAAPGMFCTELELSGCCAGVDNLHNKTTLQKAQEAVQATAAAAAEKASQAYQCATSQPERILNFMHAQHCRTRHCFNIRNVYICRAIQQKVQESNLPQKLADHTAAARDTAAAKVDDLSKQVQGPSSVPHTQSCWQQALKLLTGVSYPRPCRRGCTTRLPRTWLPRSWPRRRRMPRRLPVSGSRRLLSWRAMCAPHLLHAVVMFWRTCDDLWGYALKLNTPCYPVQHRHTYMLR